jgi:hypothetical protein
MLTSAKIGKQNGDTRTRKPEPGYLNLSNIENITREHKIQIFSLPLNVLFSIYIYMALVSVTKTHAKATSK